MNGRIKFITASLVVLLVGFAGVVVLARYEVQRGFSARAAPSSIEILAARAARGLAVPREFKALRNPVSPSPENVQAGLCPVASLWQTPLRLACRRPRHRLTEQIIQPAQMQNLPEGKRAEASM
jgi:hypothetical protein